MKKLISIILLTIFAATFPGSAKMVFETLLVEIPVKPGEDVVTASFPFKIEDEDETIVECEVLCTCLGARVEPLNPDRSAKLNWKVGEEGVIKIRFETAKFLGTVEKAAALKLEGEEDPVLLTVRVKIPELIKVRPSNLKWNTGEEATEKVAKITIDHDEPIKIVSHVGRNATSFPYEVVTIREGWEYEVRIKPVSTAKSGMGMVSLRTDSEHPRFKRTAVYAVVRPEVKARPAPPK